jgi:hypothetical protein
MLLSRMFTGGLVGGHALAESFNGALQVELSLDPPMILKVDSHSPRSDPVSPSQETALTRCSRQQRKSGR